MTDENVTNRKNDTEPQASNPYDALFKEVMTELFSGLSIPIKTEQAVKLRFTTKEVSRKPRTIDVVITCDKEDAVNIRFTTKIEKAKHETPFSQNDKPLALYQQ